MASPTRTKKDPPSRTRQGELQRLLGDAGTVLPRQMHGTMARPAQGWYAQLNSGEEIFLGDYSSLAVAAIIRICG